MAIDNIGATTTAGSAKDNNTDYDKWKSLENIRMVDDKLNARAGFRNSKGMSQEEYEAQAKDAERKGFEKIFEDEKKKYSV